MMSQFFLALVFGLIILTGAEVWSAPSSPAQKQISTHLENAINWAQHLQDELKFQNALNREHVVQEIAGLREATQAMSADIAQVGKETPRETKEGHFVALVGFHAKIVGLIDDLEAESKKNKPGTLQMRKNSQAIANTLHDAKHQHDLELMEFELLPN